MNTEPCLLSYFIENNEVKNTCDFNLNNKPGDIVLYEVIKVINGVPLFIGEHINRLVNSINLADRTNIFSISNIANQIFSLIEYNGLGSGNIRFQVKFSLLEKPNFMAWVAPHSYPTQEQHEKGVKLLTVLKSRPDPNMKINNAAFKADVEIILKQEKCYETLLVNSNGIITEGSRSNVFFVKNNMVITPKSKNVLPGITRQKIIELASRNMISIQEADVQINDLESFDCVFISGTSPGILPVSKVNQVKFSTNNMVINTLSREYNNLTLDYIRNFDTIKSSFHL